MRRGGRLVPAVGLKVLGGEVGRHARNHGNEDTRKRLLVVDAVPLCRRSLGCSCLSFASYRISNLCMVRASGSGASPGLCGTSMNPVVGAGSGAGNSRGSGWRAKKYSDVIK